MRREANGAQKFVPRILVLACNWRDRAGPDAVTPSETGDHAHVESLRLMCSGQIGPDLVLRAFERGADGVLIAGCSRGACHYHSGNEHAIAHVRVARALCRTLGIDAKRLRLELASATDGEALAPVIEEFCAQIRELGRSPVGKALEIAAEPAAQGAGHGP